MLPQSFVSWCCWLELRLIKCYCLVPMIGALLQLLVAIRYCVQRVECWLNQLKDQSGQSSKCLEKEFSLLGNSFYPFTKIQVRPILCSWPFSCYNIWHVVKHAKEINMMKLLLFWILIFTCRHYWNCMWFINI